MFACDGLFAESMFNISHALSAQSVAVAHVQAIEMSEQTVLVESMINLPAARRRIASSL